MTARNREFAKVSIQAVLEHYGAHVPTGGKSWRRMRCPFHDDRTASASVTLEKGGRFKCFVCDVNGDGVDIIVWKENLGVAGARRFAEESLGAGGVDVREPGRRRRRVPHGSGDHPSDGEQLSLRIRKR